MSELWGSTGLNIYGIARNYIDAGADMVKPTLVHQDSSFALGAESRVSEINEAALANKSCRDCMGYCFHWPYRKNSLSQRK